MERQSDAHRSDGPAAEPGSPNGEKKPYRTPRLVTYGDLRRLTLGEKGKSKSDDDVGASGTTKR